MSTVSDQDRDGGNDPERLETLRQEAVCSLQTDPPERALTQTGQMVAAMQKAAKNQKPPEHQMVDAVNCVTDLMIEYLEKWGGDLGRTKQ